MEIFVIFYLSQECLLERRFCIIILKRVSFRGKVHLGHNLLLFPHLHFISLSAKNKLNLENDGMLELHKKSSS